MTTPATADANGPLFALWDPAVPLPTADALSLPPGASAVMVHRADADYGFLHDNAIAVHDGALFAAWYNCPAWEMVDSACIRGRRSRDGGRTWSPVELIAADRDRRGLLYVPPILYSRGDLLYAFACTMTGPDRVTGCEAFVLTGAGWRPRGRIAGPFLPNSAPVRLAGGALAMAGRVAPAPGCKPETPAVAYGREADPLAPWTVVPLGRERWPYDPFPETTLWADGLELTAIVRGGAVFTSTAGGGAWRGPFRHNLPADASKLHAGVLASGRRYLVWNYPDPEAGTTRNLLALAVGEPGSRTLNRMWRLHRGPDDALGAGPQWSYPCAIEHAGRLFVICTSEKRHSVLSIVPLAALA